MHYNAANPEIRISIFKYQSGIPVKTNAVPIQNLPDLMFSSCTVDEFFAWYYKTANIPGDPSSLQALVFQYPWNLARKRETRRIEAGDSAEFEDWRVELNEGICETHMMNEEGLLIKQQAAAAGVFRVNITEPYMSGIDRDITSMLR
jgi:hypothetical protein